VSYVAHIQGHARVSSRPVWPPVCPSVCLRISVNLIVPVLQQIRPAGHFRRPRAAVDHTQRRPLLLCDSGNHFAHVTAIPVARPCPPAHRRRGVYTPLFTPPMQVHYTGPLSRQQCNLFAAIPLALIKDIMNIIILLCILTSTNIHLFPRTICDCNSLEINVTDNRQNS